MSITAYLDGGSSDPEIEITVSGGEEQGLDPGLTFVSVDRPGWGTLAGLWLDPEQVGQLVTALQRHPWDPPAE